MANREKKGLVMLYTGNGKGKTTAALGLALRAAGHDFSVFILQFMKGSETYGEIQAIRRHLPQITVEQWGRESFVSKTHPAWEDVDLAMKALSRAGEVIRSGEYDLVILDEINVALDFRLISLDAVMKLLDERPPHVDLVLTGRWAPQPLMDRADMVSEVQEIKHHYADGVPAREGIEF